MEIFAILKTQKGTDQAQFAGQVSDPLTMHITSTQIALRKPGADKRAAYASRMLRSFKWTPKQSELLKKQSERGYWVGTYNDAARIFGHKEVVNGDKRAALVWGYYSENPERKKIQKIHIL